MKGSHGMFLTKHDAALVAAAPPDLAPLRQEGPLVTKGPSAFPEPAIDACHGSPVRRVGAARVAAESRECSCGCRRNITCAVHARCPGVARLATR